MVATASDPLAINASAGAPAYSAAEMRRLLALAAMYNGRNLGGKPGVRPGGNQLNVTLAGSTITVATGLALVEDSGFTSTRGPYWAAVDTAATLTLNAADATNPRKDIVYLRVYDTDEDSSGLRQAIPEYLAGTAAPSPSEPALPAGSIKLATIDVPQSGGGSAAVTMNFGYTVANGGILPVRTTTDRDALSVGEGQAVYVLAGSGGDALYVYDGSAWDYIRGFIICTSSTRPAHREGRVIYETDTDKVWVSDGSNWRLPKNVAGGNLGYNEITASSTGTTGGPIDTGPSVTVTLVSGRRYKVTGFFNGIRSGTSGDIAQVSLTDGSNNAVAKTGRLNIFQANNGLDGRMLGASFVAASSGSATYKMRHERVSGAGTVLVTALADSPTWVMVEDAGVAV
jgi:hypothetical protein